MLCLLVNFDEERGIKKLSDEWILSKQVLGGSFAVLFLIFRCMLWPYVSYYFQVDSYYLVSSGTAHSAAVVQYFMLINCFLTCVQIKWLGEIIEHAVTLFGGDASKPKGKTV